MYRPYTLALLIASACASSTPGDTPAPEGVSRVSVSGWTEMEMHNAPGTGSRVVPLSPDSVWAALPKVYEEVGIPDAGVDAGRTKYGNPNFRTRRIEGKRLSTYVDCGTGVTAVPNADTYQVTMSVLTYVTPAEGGTTVTTTVEGNAKPRNVSGNPVYCQSKGELEARIAQLIVWFSVGGSD